MSLIDSTNPYAPPATFDSKVARRVAKLRLATTKWNTRWDVLLLVLYGTVCLVGAPLAFMEMDSIVGSGFALLIAAVLILTREAICYRRGRPAWVSGILLAAQSLAFIGILVFVISMNGWSPEDAAQNHVDYVVGVFAVWALLLAMASGFLLPVMPDKQALDLDLDPDLEMAAELDSNS